MEVIDSQGLMTSDRGDLACQRLLGVIIRSPIHRCGAAPARRLGLNHCTPRTHTYHRLLCRRSGGRTAASGIPRSGRTSPRPPGKPSRRRGLRFQHRATWATAASPERGCVGDSLFRCRRWIVVSPLWDPVPGRGAGTDCPPRVRRPLSGAWVSVRPSVPGLAPFALGYIPPALPGLDARSNMPEPRSDAPRAPHAPEGT